MATRSAAHAASKSSGRDPINLFISQLLHLDWILATRRVGSRFRFLESFGFRLTFRLDVQVWRRARAFVASSRVAIWAEGAYRTFLNLEGTLACITNLDCCSASSAWSRVS